MKTKSGKSYNLFIIIFKMLRPSQKTLPGIEDIPATERALQNEINDFMNRKILVQQMYETLLWAGYTEWTALEELEILIEKRSERENTEG